MVGLAWARGSIWPDVCRSLRAPHVLLLSSACHGGLWAKTLLKTFGIPWDVKVGSAVRDGSVWYTVPRMTVSNVPVPRIAGLGSASNCLHGARSRSAPAQRTGSANSA